MRHAVVAALVVAFLSLGLWRGETHFLTAAVAVAAGYGISLWAWRRRR